MKSLASALPSDMGSRYDRGTASQIGTNTRTEDDQVWIRDDSHRGAGSDDAQSEMSETISNPASRESFSAEGTARTNGSWAGNVPIENTRARGRQQSSVSTSNAGFAKQGAFRENMETRVKNKYEKDKEKREEALHEEQDSDSDEDDSESEFEL